MSLSLSKASPAVLAAILFGATSFCSAADPNAVLSDRVTGELTRLDSALPAVAAAGIPKEFGDPLSDQKESLDRARAAASPLLRLYRLRSPFIEIETFAFVVGNPDGGKDVAGVEALLRAQKSSVQKNPTDRSLLIGALSEAATNRAEKLSAAERALLPR